MIKMTKNIITALNGINVIINTEYQYARLVNAKEYGDDEGLQILWWNPYVCNGESQIDAEIFPLTIEGLFRASKEARALNKQIKMNVEDNTFTFR